MVRKRLGLCGSVGVFVLLITWLAAPPVPAAAQAATDATQAAVAACPPASAAGKLSCAVRASRLSSMTRGVQAASSPSGYGPADLQSAYGIQAATEGTRQTVAIIAAGGDPNAGSDLGVYRSQYSLPACTTADGCLTVVDQSGGTNLPSALTGEPLQISTDLDMVSAVCPNCHILLVEASTASIDDLGAAVNQAVTLGAHIVNFSYYGPEDTTDTSWDSSYFSHPGVAIIAAAGNDGYTGGPVNYPAASPDVISVGGTVLDKAGATGCTTTQSGARGWCEAAWQFTTSGCSQYEPKPAWQGSTGCSGRADNDLAAVAASATSPTPIAIYDSYDLGGWSVTGGTGASSPVIAGIYADAGTPGASDSPAAYPYQHPGGGYINTGTAYPYLDGLNDVTSGSTGSCSTAALCTGGPGWDGPTGLGSPASTVSLTAAGTSTGPLSIAAGSDLCLADPGDSTANGTAIVIATCDGGTDQNWTFYPDGTFQISPGHCIGASGGHTANDTPLILWTCDGNPDMMWKIRSDGTLVNKNSGTCLADPSASTTSGTQLILWTCEGGTSQTWNSYQYQVPVSTGMISSHVDSSLCIADPSSDTADGTKIILWTCEGGTSQTWTLGANDTIQLPGGHCIGASGGNTANDTPVILWTCDGNTDMKWIARSDGSFVNANSHTCLADPSGSTQIDTQLIIWTCGGGNEQGWKLP
jgi:Ricin-type beta-trefoil lectin domain